MQTIKAVRLWSAIAVASGVIALGACNDNPLGVSNTNNPDVPRVFGTPQGVQSVVGKLFQQMWNGQQNNFGVGVQSTVMSFESHSGLANFGLGARAAIPRQTVANSLGNVDEAIIYNDFDILQRNSRTAANAIDALNTFITDGLSTGTKAGDAATLSFAYFNLGYGLGNVALLYDSAAVITPDIVPAIRDTVPSLSASPLVMDAAIKMLDSAIAVVDRYEATGATDFAIPSTWISGDPIAGATDWKQVLHSYKARFRAGEARTPAERDAEDWNAIVNDAEAGITSDFIIEMNTTTGWGAAWRVQYSVDATWSQMTPMILGMADTTGAYETWLAEGLDAKVPFLMHTPDQRFPAGADQSAQEAASGAPGKAGTPPGSNLYYYNRAPGDDKPAAPWGSWYYDNQRFWSIRANAGNGPVVAFAKAENDMLAAEGYMRTGRTSQAIPLINLTRVAAGLPAIPAGASQTDQVPGGAGCVPQVPQPPNFTTTACGTVYEAMKWEKRNETAFTGYAQWFIDSRGWGDLTFGTILEWPVPWQELYARGNKNLYTTDQPSDLAGPGTYGCPGPENQCQ